MTLTPVVKVIKLFSLPLTMRHNKLECWSLAYFLTQLILRVRLEPTQVKPIIVNLLVSISPIFYEQLLRPNPFAKKLQTQTVSTL